MGAYTLSLRQTPEVAFLEERPARCPGQKLVDCSFKETWQLVKTQRVQVAASSVSQVLGFWATTVLSVLTTELRVHFPLGHKEHEGGGREKAWERGEIEGISVKSHGLMKGLNASLREFLKDTSSPTNR